MKYSEVILTDDNFDEEFEKLQEVHGSQLQPDDEWFWVEKQLEGFTPQENPKGFTEYVQSSVNASDSIGSDFKQAYMRGMVGYEFGNSFVYLPFFELL